MRNYERKKPAKADAESKKIIGEVVKKYLVSVDSYISKLTFDNFAESDYDMYRTWDDLTSPFYTKIYHDSIVSDLKLGTPTMHNEIFTILNKEFKKYENIITNRFVSVLGNDTKKVAKYLKVVDDIPKNVKDRIKWYFTADSTGLL